MASSLADEFREAIPHFDNLVLARSDPFDIGVNWKNTSREFRAAFKAADVIVTKGHGNFETCDDRPEDLYFLLKAKCQVVAATLGVKLGDLVFAHKGTGTRLARRKPG